MRTLAAGLLALALGCGKPAAEPLPPEPVGPADAEIDAGVVYGSPRPAPEIDRSGTPPAGIRPERAGDPMPALPPPTCEDPALRAEEIDLNGDGRLDVRKLYAGTRMYCRLADLNMDGTFDTAVIEDDLAGRMEFMDLDFDGRTDVVMVHGSAGATVLTLRDTDGDGVVNTVTP